MWARKAIHAVFLLFILLGANCKTWPLSPRSLNNMTATFTPTNTALTINSVPESSNTWQILRFPLKSQHFEDCTVCHQTARKPALLFFSKDRKCVSLFLISLGLLASIKSGDLSGWDSLRMEAAQHDQASHSHRNLSKERERLLKRPEITRDWCIFNFLTRWPIKADKQPCWKRMEKTSSSKRNTSPGWAKKVKVICGSFFAMNASGPTRRTRQSSIYKLTKPKHGDTLPSWADEHLSKDIVVLRVEWIDTKASQKQLFFIACEKTPPSTHSLRCSNSSIKVWLFS